MGSSAILAQITTWKHRNDGSWTASVPLQELLKMLTIPGQILHEGEPFKVDVHAVGENMELRLLPIPNPTGIEEAEASRKEHGL